jgi:hypothetical protein
MLIIHAKGVVEQKRENAVCKFHNAGIITEFLLVASANTSFF